MKKFITNNWKKIIIFIGLAFIVINVFSKLIIEKTLLDDYIKYGKDIEKPEIMENVGEAISSVESPVGPEMMKLIAIVIGLILLVVILTTLAERAGAKPKKK